MINVSLLHFNHVVRDGVISWHDVRKSKFALNYGDHLVCASIVRILDLPPDAPISVFGIPYKTSPDLVILRGSTYLHNEMNFDAANRTLESIQSPIVCIGLGAQSPSSDVRFLDGNEGAKRFVSLLSERSKSISVRGRFTANVMERLGAKDIRITGCPSLFYNRTVPSISLTEILRTRYRRIGLSIHSALEGGSIFCRNSERVQFLHAKNISEISEYFSTPKIFEQGNMLEFKISNPEIDYGERLEAAKAFIEQFGLDDLEPERLISCFVSVSSVDEWIGKARDLDALIGFRFHGNMVGLLQGIPCFFYSYDSRIREFCELYELPYREVEDDYTDPVGLILKHNWDATNAAVRRCFFETKSFLIENQAPMRSFFKDVDGAV